MIPFLEESINIQPLFINQLNIPKAHTIRQVSIIILPSLMFNGCIKYSQLPGE